ncbi:MAG: cell division protein FtsQ/DivIB [Gaiellaceae bacterium]
MDTAAPTNIPAPVDSAPLEPAGPSPFRLVAVALVACTLALLAYGLVDWTGTFEIKSIEVTGATPELTRDVELALASLKGESLVSLGAADVRALAREVPYVLAVKVDRDFPNALKVKLILHEPVAVVRSGPGAWIVSSRGHVLEAVKPTASPGLPRVWIPAGASPEAGELMRSSTAIAAARAIGRLPQPFPLRVVSARGNIDDLTLIVGETHGVEVRLGEAEELTLKLQVAAQVLRSLPRSDAQILSYLDVSVPERPVASWVPSEESTLKS